MITSTVVLALLSASVHCDYSASRSTHTPCRYCWEYDPNVYGQFRLLCCNLINNWVPRPEPPHYSITHLASSLQHLPPAHSTAVTEPSHEFEQDAVPEKMVAAALLHSSSASNVTVDVGKNASRTVAPLHRVPDVMSDVLNGTGLLENGSETLSSSKICRHICISEGSWNPRSYECETKELCCDELHASYERVCPTSKRRHIKIIRVDDIFAFDDEVETCTDYCSKPDQVCCSNKHYADSVCMPTALKPLPPPACIDELHHGDGAVTCREYEPRLHRAVCPNDELVAPDREADGFEMFNEPDECWSHDECLSASQLHRCCHSRRWRKKVCTQGMRVVTTASDQYCL